MELYKDLRGEHTASVQRIHATLFHQGVPAVGGDLCSAAGRARLAAGEGLSETGRQAIAVAPRILDALGTELDGLYRQLARFARRQHRLSGSEGPVRGRADHRGGDLGDARRFSSSRQAVRHAGLDVTVHSSDGKRSQGHLSRQGSALLRWAVYEAGYCAARTTSPDHDYYQQVRGRAGGNRAALVVARKILRRSHHILCELGDRHSPPV